MEETRPSGQRQREGRNDRVPSACHIDGLIGAEYRKMLRLAPRLE